MKVVYGHTDSIYVQCPSIEVGQQVVQEINEHVRESFPNILGLEEHPVNLEFEKYFSSLGVGTTKNRNAGLISWEDGYHLDEPKFTMTGFTAKRISETTLAKRVQLTTLRMWVEGKSRKDINAYLNQEYTDVMAGNIPLTDIVKRSRLRESRFDLKCSGCNKKYNLFDCYELDFCTKCSASKSKFLTAEGKRPTYGAGMAGILYGKEKLEMNYDDSFLFLKVSGINDTFTHPLTDVAKSVDYISASTFEDFDSYTPDWPHYAKQVISKAEPIYKAMDWDIHSIRTGKIQTSFEDWW